MSSRESVVGERVPLELKKQAKELNKIIGCNIQEAYRIITESWKGNKHNTIKVYDYIMSQNKKKKR